jgi:iron complex transport system ATP-binding protein
MALRAEGLIIRYGARTAVDGVSLALPTGQSLALIGPNGSGKTTLLHAIAGLVSPTAGTLVRDPGPVSLVLQATDVDRSLPITVRDCVRMGRYPARGLLGRFAAGDHAAVAAAMERLDVADLADRQLHDLSGGQRQRALVAQGLAQDHELLLLDEPVNGLDPPSRDLILSVVDEERAQGRTVVLSTHNLDDAGRCDRVLLLATRAIAFGAPEDVLREHHLRAAFGSLVARVGGELVMDDPHHVH